MKKGKGKSTPVQHTPEVEKSPQQWADVSNIPESDWDIPHGKSQARMPQGKRQFGLIVPVEIHRKAKQIAADNDWRISGSYEQGIQLLSDIQRNGMNLQNIILSNELLAGLPDSDRPILKALADMLRSNQRGDKIEMLLIMLREWLPEGYRGSKGRQKISNG